MYKHILVAIDLGHPESLERSFPIAEMMAKSCGAKLSIMTVVPNFGMSVVGSFFPADFERNALAQSKQQLQKVVAEKLDANLVETVHVAHGTIYEEIIDVADKLGSDLIILSSHRPELKDYLLGPNAARVARHANQSILIVRE
ncbi:MAG: universal stress protein [Fimbriimonadaceae bacterium]|nr:universal stress protein [Alphaproteobacteria bacterium]